MLFSRCDGSGHIDGAQYNTFILRAVKCRYKYWTTLMSIVSLGCYHGLSLRPVGAHYMYAYRWRTNWLNPPIAC